MKTVRNLNSLTIGEILALCATYTGVTTERHHTHRRDFTYQSQYVRDVYKLIRWAIKAKELQITFHLEHIYID